jgi:hypothetical protein
MYEFIGNALFMCLTIGAYNCLSPVLCNYCSTKLYIKTSGLAEMAKMKNIAHISTDSIKKQSYVEPHDVTKNQDSFISRLLGNKTKIDISNCKIDCSIFKTDRLLSSSMDSSNYVITNGSLATQSIMRYSNVDATPYKIKFPDTVAEPDVVLKCKTICASLFQYMGVNKLIEKISDFSLRFMGFNYSERFNSRPVWTYVVSRTDPIMFFPESGIGFDFVRWGYLLKSYNRTVNIFPVTDMPRKLDDITCTMKMNRDYYSRSHDIMAHPSRARDAEDYIKDILSYKSSLIDVSDNVLVNPCQASSSWLKTS